MDSIDPQEGFQKYAKPHQNPNFVLVATVEEEKRGHNRDAREKLENSVGEIFVLL